MHSYQIEIHPSERACSGGIYDEGRRGWLVVLENNQKGQQAFKQNQWNHVQVEIVGNKMTDLGGNVIKEKGAGSIESGTALGGDGDTSTAHINLFNAVRGTKKLQAPIDEAAIINAIVHQSNMAYRTGKDFSIDDKTGRIFDRDAMVLRSREYEKSWESTL